MSHCSLEGMQTPVSDQNVGTGWPLLPHTAKVLGIGFSPQTLSGNESHRKKLSQRGTHGKPGHNRGPGFTGVCLPPVPHPKEDYVAQGQWQAGHALSLHAARDRTNAPSHVGQVQSHRLVLPTAVTLDNTTSLLPSRLPQFPNSFSFQPGDL